MLVKEICCGDLREDDCAAKSPSGGCLTTLLMPALVILSEAKNLIISGIYAFEILRLTPQNDVVGQLLGEILLTDTAFILAQALLSESPPMGAPPFRVGP